MVDIWESIKIRFILEGDGWGRFVVTHKTESLSFLCSWLTDGKGNSVLDLILMAMTQILQGNTKSDFLLIEEPGSNLCLLDKMNDYLEVRFGHSEFLYCHRNDEDLKIVFKFKIKYNLFIIAIYEMFLDLQKELNTKEKEENAGFIFPIDKFIEYEKLINDKTQ